MNIMIKSRHLLTKCSTYNCPSFSTMFKKCMMHENIYPLRMFHRTILLTQQQNSSLNEDITKETFNNETVLKDSPAFEKRAAILDVDTNVQNDVLLYRYEDTKYNRFILLMVFCQSIVWGIIAYTCFLLLPAGDITSFTSFMMYIKGNILQVLMFLWSFMAVPLGSFVLLFSRGRTVSYIILRKGGKSITIGTPDYWLGTRFITASLKNVYLTHSRHGKIQYFPLKIENITFFFLIPRKGEFINNDLFDNALGKKK